MSDPTAVDFDTFAAVVADTFELPVELLSSAALLTEDLGFDSLMFVELHEMLEDSAGHWIADEALQSLRTVGDVYRFWADTPAARPAPHETANPHYAEPYRKDTR